jgi:hypothetical protein
MRLRAVDQHHLMEEELLMPIDKDLEADSSITMIETNIVIHF